MIYFEELLWTIYVLLLHGLNFCIAEKSGLYGQMSQTVEPNGTPDLSPATANDDSLDGAGSIPNRNNDEVDDDDFFSKRRYYGSQSRL